MGSWLVHSPPDQAVWFAPWPGTLCCVLGEDTNHSASLHRGV